MRDPKLIPKVLLTRLGARCSARVVYNANGVFNYLHVGWWLRSHGFEPVLWVSSREQLFDVLAASVRDRQVLYLEFGVHRGESMRAWSRLLRNPESRLHGFDSFLGLPHDWTLEGHPRGFFSTSGVPPEIDDPRVTFFTGWFEETLPAYEWRPFEVLIIMLDADLYTSTSTALRHIAEHLAPGAYLYFDQFHHRCDELRAFAEFLDEHSMGFDLVIASRDLTNLLFRRVE